jgi:lipopolysaccharide transport system permease protein
VSTDARAVEINEARSAWSLPSLADVWDHRELIWYLGRRDIAVRYKQTVVGVAWAVAQPLLLAAIFSVFLGVIARTPPSGDTPYPLYALTGMTMWFFFTAAMSRASDSTVSSVELISKVYFPRVIIPLAALIQPAVDFAIATSVLLAVMVAYGVVVGVHALMVPVVFALAAATALGIGLWMSALVVRYRDVRHVVPYLVQVMLFVTPVLYPLSLIPANYRLLYSLNPLVGVMEAWRWALLPGSPAPGALLVVPVVSGIVLIVSGLFYFQRAQASFADVI